jgi:hypothetical protein
MCESPWDRGYRHGQRDGKKSGAGDLALMRNCLGNLFAAVKRFGPVDAYSSVETPVIPDGDRCDLCGIWLPPVAEWSMPSCPDCVEAFEADELKPPLDKPHRHF